MNLDDRARRAARALHQAATPTELEVPAAADRVRSAASARQRRVATARIAAAGVAVLAAALVGGVLSSGGSSDDGDEVAVQRTTTTTVPVPDSTLPDARAQFEAVPASPIDGRDSYRLPVIATPRDGLTDGQTITLLGKGFEPNERVGLVQCAAEALYELQAACDLLGPAGEAEARTAASPTPTRMPPVRSTPPSWSDATSPPRTKERSTAPPPPSGASSASARSATTTGPAAPSSTSRAPRRSRPRR